jgi:hypothetical protein
VGDDDDGGDGVDGDNYDMGIAPSGATTITTMEGLTDRDCKTRSTQKRCNSPRGNGATSNSEVVGAGAGAGAGGDPKNVDIATQPPPPRARMIAMDSPPSSPPSPSRMPECEARGADGDSGSSTGTGTGTGTDSGGGISGWYYGSPSHTGSRSGSGGGVKRPGKIVDGGKAGASADNDEDTAAGPFTVDKASIQVKIQRYMRMYGTLHRHYRKQRKEWYDQCLY